MLCRKVSSVAYVFPPRVQRHGRPDVRSGRGASVPLERRRMRYHGGRGGTSSLCLAERKDMMAMTMDEHNTPALDAAHLAALRAQLEAEHERLRGILQGLDAEVQAAEPASDEP